ncbi:MAG TPA: ATP-binding protein [Candidatus Saccharibacteria bacterium]|jgi:predicted kinase|nr:ATP-binding protein [Candidatus Saccharibacteria bacterium]
MNKLELDKPLAIVMMGIPGAGKTFFARQLANNLNIGYISEDRIRFDIYNKPSFTSEEQIVVRKIMGYMIEELSRVKKHMVLDGRFLNASERQKVHQVMTNAGYQVLTVWVQTEEDLAKRRASKRDKRKPDDKYNDPVPIQEFNSIKLRLEKPEEKEDFSVVSGKHTFKSQLETVLKRINSLYRQAKMNDARKKLKSR